MYMSYELWVITSYALTAISYQRLMHSQLYSHSYTLTAISVQYTKQYSQQYSNMYQQLTIWRIVVYHDSIACIAQWFNLYYPTVTSRILLVQSILPNYKTSDTPPPDPPLQRRRARKSTYADPTYFLVYWIYADPIYFFSTLDVVKHLHGKGRKYSTENMVLRIWHWLKFIQCQ